MPRPLVCGRGLAVVLVAALVGCGNARHELTLPPPGSSGNGASVLPMRVSTLAFEPSVGRTAPGIDYLAHGQGFTLGLTRRGPIISAGSGAPVRTELIGANPGRAHRAGRLQQVVNSYIGKDRRNWHTGIPTFGRVRYNHAWPGIDVAYHGRDGRLEYDFHLKPGADPRRIAWRFDGARRVTVDARGDLIVTDSVGASLRQPRPDAWQYGRAGRELVDARFVVRGGVVRLQVGGYDRRRPLTIDPVLAYSTYLGGTNTIPGGIALDSDGAMYVTGEVVDPSTWPDSSGATTFGDVGYGSFVAKIRPDGTALDYLTIFGGTGDVSQAVSIAVGGDGAAYVSGSTDESDFPTTATSVQPAYSAGGGDIFVIKLDASGARDYATFIGGDGIDTAQHGSTLVTPDGSVIVGGYSSSTTLDTTTGALQKDNPIAGVNHGIIAKLAPDGGSYSYFTWFGSATGQNFVTGLAQDSSGKVYVVGTLQQGKLPGVADADAVAGKTESFPAPHTAYWTFVGKLTLTANTAPTWVKIKGGTGDDQATAIAVDSTGVPSITGFTLSDDWAPIGSLAPPAGDQRDVFVLHLGQDGSDDWGTAIGGAVSGSGEVANAIATDAEGNLYVVATNGADWPLHNNSGIQSGSAGGDSEVVVLKLRHDGPVAIYSSYLGSSGEDEAQGAAVDSHGALYLTGYAHNNDFNTVNPMQGYVGTPGDVQGFVSKIVPYLPSIDAGSVNEGTATQTTSASFQFSAADPETSFKCFLDRGAPAQQVAACSGGTKTYAGPLPDGSHTFEVQALDQGGTTDGRFAARHWTVDTTAPEAFTLQGPDDGAVVGQLPDFKWNAATDATTGVKSYKVLVDGQQVAETTGCCNAAPTTPLAQGDHTWKVIATDGVGLTRESNARKITVVEPLVAKLTVSPNPALVGAAVTLDASASATATHPVSNYAFDLDGDGSYEHDNGSAPAASTTFATPGLKTVAVQVTDSVGLVATAVSTLQVNDRPALGTQFGVSINNGAQYTRTPNVTVTAKFPANITSMLFSNDGGFFTPAQFAPAPTVKWKLDSSGPERLPKTIYVRFLTGLIPSETFQDDIILDETPPVVQQAAVSGPPTASAVHAAKAKLRKWKVKVKATDSNSGVSGIQITSSKRKPGKVLKYKKSLTVKSAKRPGFVRARDRAGNFSRWKKAR